MISNLPILIALCPFLGALISPLISLFSAKAVRAYVTIINGIGLCLSVYQLYRVITIGNVEYRIGNWEVPYGIVFSIDTINALVICMVFFIGFLSILSSLPYFRNDNDIKEGRSTYYFLIMSLLILGLAGMSSTGDIFNLYVFLEITSLSGYTLIALGGSRGCLSAFRYLMIGTIGASFYLLGVALLYGQTGTLNMADMRLLLSQIPDNGTTLTAMLLFMAGFGIKMALFPLHSWQPDAYTNSHPGAAPLISGVMGKIPALAMVRFFYFIFPSNSDYKDQVLLTIGLMSCAGMIYGSLRAMKQRDFRRLLAFSSIAQIGYIGLGVSIGGYYGLIGACLHILGHCMMKSGLFFSAGAIRYRYRDYDMTRFGRLYRDMPITSACMVVCGLSMVGIPPMVGFFSKWYLALGAASSGLYIYIGVLVLSSLLNAIYFFRLFEALFMDKEPEPGRDDKMKGLKDNVSPLGETHPLPICISLPVVMTALAVILLGVFNSQVAAVIGRSLAGL